jgi:hypothetical protein
MAGDRQIQEDEVNSQHFFANRIGDLSCMLQKNCSALMKGKFWSAKHKPVQGHHVTSVMKFTKRNTYYKNVSRPNQGIYQAPKKLSKTPACLLFSLRIADM